MIPGRGATATPATPVTSVDLREPGVAENRRLDRALREVSERSWKLRPELLLTGGIPQPLHGLAPRVVLGKAWWDAARRTAYRSTGYHCQACGVYKDAAKGRRWLEGHEVYRIDFLAGTMKYLETVPLCHFCHCYTHRGRLKALLEQRLVTQAKYAAIIQHGDAILAAVGITRTIPPVAYQVPWGEWRLIIGRKRYKPLYRNLDEWEQAHAKIKTDAYDE